MLSRLIINHLFNTFDYDLDFSNNSISILTGPNGYGKSSILRIINTMANGTLIDLLSMPYKEIIAISDNSKKFRIAKYEDYFTINNSEFPFFDLDYDLTPGQKSALFRIRSERLLDTAGESINEFRNILRHGLLHREEDFIFAMLDYLYEIDRPDSNLKNEITQLFKTLYEIEEFRSSLGKVGFIQEQRLLEKKKAKRSSASKPEASEKIVSVIEENSANLTTILDEYLRKHSLLSSELDSSYLKRLFSEANDTLGTYSDDLEYVQNRLKYLEDEQEKLRKFGLTEIENVSYINNLEQSQLDKFKAELSIYIEDAERKCEVFEPIIEKLELYENIVNQKLLFKKMHLSSTRGIYVIDDNDEEVSLNDLSSGEKEILVLFYKIIFESDVNLLLIDEPEISLHIRWQKELMDNFKSIVNINKNISIILATHSPQIIANNWDLQIDLGGID